MSAIISYDEIGGKSADELFTEYSVEDLGELITRLSDDINTKRHKLKILVGDKYRDLLHVADDIIEMNEITFEENEQLMSLAFKRSNYNAKSLSNLSKFNTHLQQVKIEQAQKSNRSTILRNVIHDLNYSLISLKQSLDKEVQFVRENHHLDTTGNNENLELSPDLDESLEYYKPISSGVSNNFVLIAKLIYLIDYYFNSEISNQPKSFASVKYKQLCEEFQNIVEMHMMRLKYESDFDFLLKLSISYLICNKKEPIDVIRWVLDKRLEHFQQLLDNRVPFQELLNYVFFTIEYINLLQSRLPVLTSRLKTNVGTSNWIQQTSFQKWSKWLSNVKKTKINHSTDLEANDDEFEFHYDIKNYNIDKAQVNELFYDWKLEIGNLLAGNFDLRFGEVNDNLLDSVVLLRYVLVSFKHYSSLSELPIKNKNLTDFILDTWSESYLSTLSTESAEFDKIGEIIFETFNNEELISSTLTTNLDFALFEFDEKFDTQALFSTSIKIENDNTDKVLILLGKFKHDLKSINNSLEALKNLTKLVLKPILTIDDYEADEFWVDVSKKLKDILNKSVKISMKILNESIKDFFNKLLSILDAEASTVSNLRIFYIVRILVQLEEKILLNDTYEKFNKYSSSLIDGEINLSSLVKPLLENCFQILVTNTFSKQYSDSLKQLLKNRFSEDVNYPELNLWDEISDGKLIPTTCSFEYLEILMSFCNDLVTVDGKDYSKVFALPSFATARRSLINVLINQFKLSLQEIKPEKVSDDKVILTYSDYIFTSFLLDSETPVSDDATDENFVKLSNVLQDSDYRRQVSRSLFENYKSQSLMYYPLAK